MRNAPSPVAAAERTSLRKFVTSECATDAPGEFPILASVLKTDARIYRAAKTECRRFPRAAAEDLRLGSRRNFQVFDVHDFLRELRLCAKPLRKASGRAAAKPRSVPHFYKILDNSPCAARLSVSEPERSAISCVRFHPPTPRPRRKPTERRRNRLQDAAESDRSSTEFLTKRPPQSYSERPVGIQMPVSLSVIGWTCSDFV